MTRKILLSLAMVLLAYVHLAAEAKTAIMVLPSGSSTVHALFTAARDFFRTRGYSIDEAVPDQKIRASQTAYNSASAGQAGTIQSTLSWLLELRTEGDGRIVVTITHDAYQIPAEDVPLFAQNLAAGAVAKSAQVSLTFDGETKPLLEWKQGSRPKN